MAGNSQGPVDRKPAQWAYEDVLPGRNDGPNHEGTVPISSTTPASTSAGMLQGASPVVEHLFTTGLVGGQFADTILCVAAPAFAKVYPVHALILAREPVFHERLMALRSHLAATHAAAVAAASAAAVANAAAISVASGSPSHENGDVTPTRMALAMPPPPPPPMGVDQMMPNTSPVALPDDASLAVLGFVRGRDYLWRVDVVLPELASEDAMGLVLSYIYTGMLPPPTLTPAQNLAVLCTATSIGLVHIVQHISRQVRDAMSLVDLNQYLPLLSTQWAALFTSYLCHQLAQLPRNSRTSSADVLATVCAQLPWALLKAVIEDDHAHLPHWPGAGKTDSFMGVALTSGAHNLAACPTGAIAADHGRFEFAKHVLALRRRPEESVVVAFGGGGSGVMLVRRGERRTKKVWKVAT